MGTRKPRTGRIVRLAIADPPYPPQISERFDLVDGSARLSTRSRARRYYGDHPDAGEWDLPERHRRLMLELLAEFDGWAIATSPDGLAAYGDLPTSARIFAWVVPNRPPSGRRIRACWEAVILFPPEGRRGRIQGRAAVPDVLIAPGPRIGFTGAKPAVWTRWVLDALGYDPDLDELVDLFPGSGSVSTVLAHHQPSIGGM